MKNLLYVLQRLPGIKHLFRAKSAHDFLFNLSGLMLIGYISKPAFDGDVSTLAILAIFSGYAALACFTWNE